jgi:hypothetical protein
MIRHHAVRQQPHANALRRAPNQIDKSLIVTFLSENILASIAAVDDVVADFSNRGPGRPGHAAILPRRKLIGKEK